MEAMTTTIEQTEVKLRNLMGKFKEDLYIMGDKPAFNIEAISTGSYFINIATGIGGIPRGRITEVWGEEMSGKTTLAIHVCIEAQKQYPNLFVGYIDVEHALDLKYAKNIGLDLKKATISQPDCVYIKEYVLTNKGYIKLEDLFFDKIYTLNNKQTKLSSFEKSNEKQKLCYQLITNRSNGIFSEDHRILTFNGYKKIKDLKVTDSVATHIGNKFFNKESDEIKYEDAIMIGILIADGTYNTNNIRVALGEKKLQILNWIKNHINKNFKDVEIKSNDIQHRISKKIPNSHKNSSFSKYYHKYLGYNSGLNKFIPQEIFKCGDDVLSGLIKGLWSCDGSVISDKNYLEFSSTIKSISLNVQAILNHFGIYSYYKEKSYYYNNELKTDYIIIVNNKEGIELFKEKIGLIGYKNDLLNNINTAKKESYIKFPKDIWDIIFNEIKTKYKNITEFSRIFHKHNDNRHHFNTQREVSINYLKKINKYLESTILYKYIKQDICYSKISNLRKLVKLPTEDLYVPNSHNFICNNLIVHNSGERAIDIAENLIRSGTVSVVIIDSVAALTPEADLLNEVTDKTQASLARLMSKAWKRLKNAASATNTALFFINQERIVHMGQFTKKGPTGGNTLKFGASMRMALHRDKTPIVHKNGDTTVHIASKVTAKVVKNKLAPPFREAEFYIVFGKGISKIDDIFDIAVQSNVINKSGNWYSYNDSMKENGRIKSVKFLLDHENILNEITEKVNEYYKHCLV